MLTHTGRTDSEIYTITARGGDKVQVTKNNREDGSPVYSPSGKKLAYVAFDGTDYEIYTIKVGGGDKFRVTNNDRYDSGPDYSPDGKRIAYMARDESESGISTIKVGGGGKINLSDNDTDSYDDFAPEYSPNGKKIVFMTYDDQEGTWLSTINVDGSNETEITERDPADYAHDAFVAPSWGSK